MDDDPSRVAPRHRRRVATTSNHRIACRPNAA